MHIPNNSDEFEMLAGQPVGLIKDLSTTSDISEAIELCFPMDTDDAKMIWGGIDVPVNYKYDVSVVYEDIMELLCCCLKRESTTVYFGSNTFSGTLSIYPIEDSYIIRGSWDSLFGCKEVELNRIPKLRVSRSSFVNSWCSLLKEVLRTISQSNVSMELKRDLDDLHSCLESARRMR